MDAMVVARLYSGVGGRCGEALEKKPRRRVCVQSGKFDCGQPSFTTFEHILLVLSLFSEGIRDGCTRYRIIITAVGPLSVWLSRRESIPSTSSAACVTARRSAVLPDD
jgi:hypothetical protein